MDTRKVVDSPEQPKKFYRHLRVATLSLLIGGGLTGLYWQGIHILRQRSEAVVVQLEELTDSVRQLQVLLQTDSTERPETEPTGEPAKGIENQAQSYWLTGSGNDIRLSPQPLGLDADAEPEVALTNALETLLLGVKPGSSDVTAIPEGTELLDLKITPRGIYVDLSSEFGQGGGSSAMTTRVAQILYTATSLDPTAGIFLSVEGQPLDEAHPLGGEGLVLTQPMTRAQFEKDFQPSLLKAIEG